MGRSCVPSLHIKRLVSLVNVWRCVAARYEGRFSNRPWLSVRDRGQRPIQGAGASDLRYNVTVDKSSAIEVDAWNQT